MGKSLLIKKGAIHVLYAPKRSAEVGFKIISHLKINKIYFQKSQARFFIRLTSIGKNINFKNLILTKKFKK